MKILDVYLSNDDEGNKRIYVPAIIIVQNGKIVEFDDETSKDTKGYKTPEEYWKNENLDALKTKLEKSFNEIKSTVCKSGCND